MGLKPKKRVLVVEDDANWWKLIGELLQEVATVLDCEIEVVTAIRFAEALNKIGAKPYDCVTVDNELPDGKRDGKRAKTLLDRIVGLDYRVPVIVISGVVDPGDVRDFFKDYEIEEFFWKNNFKPKQFKQTLARLLASVGANNEHGELLHTKIGDKHMDWTTIVSLAVSAVSPYAVAFATSAASAAGKKLVEAVPKSMKGIWQWIRETVSRSDDKSAKQTRERFEKDPESNKDALVGVIKQLIPDDDKVLRGYVQGLIQEVQLRKGAHLFSLLDNPNYYTFDDLKRICSRVNPRWAGKVGIPTTHEALARWVVDYAPTRNKQPDLIAAMLEVNPTVMLQ